MLFVYKSVIIYNVLLIIISDIVFSFITIFLQDGWTPLINAAGGGHIEVTKVLLEAGASIDAKTVVSKTISIFAYMCVCVCVCG